MSTSRKRTFKSTSCGSVLKRRFAVSPEKLNGCASWAEYLSEPTEGGDPAMQVTRWDILPVASHCQCTARSGKEKLKRTGRDAGRVGSGKSGCRARSADCRARKKRKMPSRYRCMGRSDLVAGVDEQLRSDRSPEHIAGPIRLDYPEDQIMRISGRPSPAEVF